MVYGLLNTGDCGEGGKPDWRCGAKIVRPPILDRDKADRTGPILREATEEINRALAKASERLSGQEKGLTAIITVTLDKDGGVESVQLAAVETG